MFTNRGIVKWLAALLGGFILPLAGLNAQEPAADSHDGTLEQLSSSVQRVVNKVSPAIVRIEVDGYSRGNDDGDDQAPAAHVVTKSKSVASGIILESNGYIVTNAHVVDGARRVRVILDPKREYWGVEARQSVRGNSLMLRLWGHSRKPTSLC
jgi:S1-C subfamily serine protease